LRIRVIRFVVTVQSVLFLAHWFVYKTWTIFLADPDPQGITILAALMVLASVSFVVATLIAHRYRGFFVSLLYRIAATWMGLFNFLFLAACGAWVIYLGGRLFGRHPDRSTIVAAMFGMAFLISLYGVINARSVRVNRVSVKLPGLPHSWRGRNAALVSDVHLGHLNGRGFLRGIVSALQHLAPDIVFIVGDLYDGSRVNPEALVMPWKELSVPFGSYFVTGNHEEFSDPAKYLAAVTRAGIRVLKSEKVTIDGLQIIGVQYSDSTSPARFRSILEGAHLNGGPSILLSHVPHGLQIAEKAGISLLLSGHTHGGQIFPFTWLTARVFGEFSYGLKQFGKLMVYTSCGIGTWGPPLRVGTRPEIVLIELA